MIDNRLEPKDYQFYLDGMASSSLDTVVSGNFLPTKWKLSHTKVEIASHHLLKVSTVVDVLTVSDRDPNSNHDLDSNHDPDFKP